jgi:hypothetical protein
LSDMDTRRMFEVLDPPRGGVTRLRARIRTDRQLRIRNRVLATVAAGVIVLGLIALIVLPNGGTALTLPGFESDLLAIQLGLIDPPTETVSIRPDLHHEYAVQQIPTADERIVFYMTGSR